MCQILHCIRVSIVCCICVFIGSEAANGVTYELSGDITGTLGANSFTDTPFLLTATGDASGVFSAGPGIFLNPLTSVNINISGIGTIEPVDGFDIYVNQGIPGGGFVDVFTGDVLDFTGSTLAAWNAVSTIGPVSVDQTFLGPFDTTAGSLNWTNATNLTFTATRGTATAPDSGSTFMLFGVALGGLIGVAAIESKSSNSKITMRIRCFRLWK